MAETVDFLTEVLKDYPEGLQWFKDSQFGHLFDVPNHLETNLAAMWMMLCREVETKKEHESWFVVNGIPIRFSLVEYALISGLKCSDYPDGWKDFGSGAFREFYFPGMKNVGLVDIKDRLLRMKIDCQGGQKRSKKTLFSMKK